MKLAYLASVTFKTDRAHSAQIAHMCQAFAENQAEVTLFVHQIQRHSVESIGNAFGFVPAFSLTQLPPRRFYGVGSVWFVLREFIFALHFWWWYRSHEVDLVYSRNEFFLCFLSFLVPHTMIAYESHEAGYSWAARRLLHRGVRTVAISQGIYEAYLDKGVPTTQMLVADDGIDDSFFNPTETKAAARQRLGLDQDAFIVMYVGGFAAWKGVETFFSAAQNLPDVTFVAIGGSEEQVAEASKQYPKVTFLGAQPYRDLPNNQIAADVLVVPNTGATALSSRYTSPLKLFAHMASGVPLVISDIPSLTTVTGTDYATLVQSDDPDLLAASIVSVRDQYEERLRAAAELRELAKEYTWKKRAERILHHIQT